MVKIVPGDKQTVHYGWGDSFEFHSIDVNGKKFELSQYITVETIDHRTYTGQLVTIEISSLAILPDNENAKFLNYYEISSVNHK